jgi:hypothetical protein
MSVTFEALENLTDMSKDGRILIKGWDNRYPIYAMGQA